MTGSSGYKLFIVSAIAQIISFVAGTCLTWSSPVQPKLNGTDDNPLGQILPPDGFESTCITSLLPVGAIFGSVLFGMIVERFGRKPTLVFLGFPFAIGYLMLAFTKNIWCFYFARTIQGLAVGGVFTVIPMYSGEIAEDSNRGALGVAMNCFLTLGLLLSNCLGPFTSFMLFNTILSIFPVLFIVLFSMFGPESPHFLIKKDFFKAEECLRCVRGSYDVSKELCEIKQTVEKSEGGSFIDIIRVSAYRKAFIIGAGLLFFQQFSGINIVLFNGQTVFQDAIGEDLAKYGPIIDSAVQFGTSFITPILSDRAGRKVLLTISHVSMVVVEVAFGMFFFLKSQGNDVSHITWMPVACLVLYITVYNIGSGPIPWATLGELYPANIKSFAAAGASAVCWTCGSLINFMYPVVSNMIGIGETFWLFSGFGVLATLFVIFCVIETKGKSLQQIQNELSS